MTRDDRLRWIARHLSSVGVRYNGDGVPGGDVYPGEISSALIELVELRAEKARNWQPPPPSRLRRWLMGKR